MKLSPSFELRDVCGEQILVAVGSAAIDYSHVIHLNETAAYLWRELSQRPSFVVEDMVDLLCREYEGAPYEAVLADCVHLIDEWKKYDLAVDD